MWQLSFMPRNRFKLLLSNFHFAVNMSIDPEYRLGNILSLIEKLQKKYQDKYTAGEDIIIDETLSSWRRKLTFKQYVPNKAHKYGFILFK